MSIEKFKAKVGDNEKTLLGLEYIANSLRNNHELYIIEKKNEYSRLLGNSDSDFLGADLEEDFYLEWEHVDLDRIFVMFNNLGLSSELLKDKIEQTKSYYEDYIYSKLDFNEVWKIVNSLNPVEMCYAISSIISSVYESSNIFKYIIIPFEKALKDYLDEDIVELLHLNFTETVFIAMWFDKSMESYERAFIKAVEKCGYTPRIIKDKEYNGSIVPEIFYEIRKCKFVVADFTGNRGSVYYEAGYAEALGKKVIQCCKSEDFDNIHFDVSHIKTIIWDDEKDLEQRLIRRINSSSI